MNRSRSEPRGSPARSPSLVEPTSVTRASSALARSASATSPGRAPTGAAQKTTSAPATASPAEAQAWSSASRSMARSSVVGSASNPATTAPSRRLAASPIEPPISPTPRTATLIAPLDAGDLLAGELGDAAELLRVLGEALGGDRLRTVADRLLRLVVDLDDDPVGAGGRGGERHRLHPVAPPGGVARDE